MTRELILDNCIRISQFYNNEINYEGLKSEISIVSESLKGLLDTYTRILDYNGAPPRNLSRLYITNEAFIKMLDEINNIGIAMTYTFSNHTCYFEYNGYNWEVINEDEAKKERQKTLDKIKKNQ